EKPERAPDAKPEAPSALANGLNKVKSMFSSGGGAPPRADEGPPPGAEATVVAGPAVTPKAGPAPARPASHGTLEAPPPGAPGHRALQRGDPGPAPPRPGPA